MLTTSPEPPFSKSALNLFRPKAEILTGEYLSSRGVATQVLSAYECLTAVFGMGTGGTTQPSSPETFERIQKSKGIFEFPENRTGETTHKDIV